MKPAVLDTKLTSPPACGQVRSSAVYRPACSWSTYTDRPVLGSLASTAPPTGPLLAATSTGAASAALDAGDVGDPPVDDGAPADGAAAVDGGAVDGRALLGGSA